MIKYEFMSAAEAHEKLRELGDVLQACVQEGASVGFTHPDDRQAIDRFWKDKVNGLANQECELLIARDDNSLVGTVMINYCGMPNGSHRAEISKLLVHPHARRQGIARQLMNQAEQRAWEKGLSLLVLDTRSGDVASTLYLSLGWQIAGSIPCYAESIEHTLDATTYMYKMGHTLSNS